MNNFRDSYSQIEITPGHGGRLVRSAGNSAVLLIKINVQKIIFIKIT